MEYTEILYDQNNHRALITLNRPEKRNSLSARTVSELCHALERAREAESVRVVILTGTGPFFCAGGDLSQLGRASSFEGAEAVAPRTYVDLMLLLTRMGKPTIAKINGSAFGGGLGLVVACDVAVAADTAQFATPEINVGLWPMMIMAHIFRNMGRKSGMRLVLFGEKISAGEAARLGLITEAVPAMELEARTQELVENLIKKSPAVLRLGLEAFYAAQDMAFEPSLDYLEERLAAVLSTEDAHEGLRAFLEKRAPIFHGR
jgi:enoyl-CoA hydratase/carnithine racemase